MSLVNQCDRDRLSEAWARRERIVDRFEDACQRGEAPAISEYLPDGNTDPELLAQLVHADLEFRLSQREPARVEAYLERYPELTADRRAVVAFIAAEYELRRRRERALTPQEYHERFPQYAPDLLHLEAGPDATVNTPGEGGPPLPTSRPGHADFELPANGVVPAESGPSRPVLPGYEILGELGRGGMGVVYKARHIRLKRVVAVKMILAGPHAGPEELTRFRVEAEAVAQLKHPNIVQIYEVGEYEGRPYCALEYVDGGSLAQRIAGTPQPPQEAAPLVETLARAMHHAHQRGIVHRDLKPANVLLQRTEDSGQQTADGERPAVLCPKITDFGLAKRLDVDLGQTRSGALLGTPSYMAPEQATGQLKQISPATDVYALGAILYELLTGRPPFKAATLLDTLEQVRGAEVVPPRRFQPKVPCDLETICLKCLQKQPLKRYASAEALAEDLRRFQTGEAIQSRPTPAWERGWKWAKRRPAMAALLAVSGLAAIILLAVWIRFTNELQIERTTVTQERDRVKEQRAEALKYLKMARQAVDEYSLKVSRDPRLLDNFRPLRQELLQTVVPFYEEFVAQQSNDEQIQAQLGRACMQLAFITQEIGEETKAIVYHERAVTIFAQLMRDHPTNADFQRHCAISHHSLGGLFTAAGKTEEAEGAYQQALTLQRQLFDQHPEEAEYQSDLAKSYGSLGNLYGATNRAGRAVVACEAGLTLLSRLSDKYPEVSEYQFNLAGTHHNLGLLYYTLEETIKAEQSLLGAQFIFRRLADGHPEVTRYRSELARCLNTLGALYHARGLMGKAETAWLESSALRRDLVAQRPEVTQYQNDLASSLNNTGALYRATGKAPEAERAYQESVKVRKRLADEHPGVLEYTVNLGETYGNIANLLNEGKTAHAALDRYALAISCLDVVLAKDQRSVRARKILCNTHLMRADTLSKLGRHSEAVLDWDRALKLDNGTSRIRILSSRTVGVARTGDHARAIADASDLAQNGSLVDDALYYLATAYALAATAVANDGKLAQTERDKLTDQYAARAVEFLGRANKAGYFKNRARADNLKKDKDLATLRCRADFGEFLGELHGKPQGDAKTTTK